MHLYFDITELCVRDEKYYSNWYLKSTGIPNCLISCISATTLNQKSGFRIISWRYLRDSKKPLISITREKS